MLELTEAVVISRQLDKEISGKIVQKVITAHSPHKWAWYHGNHEDYDRNLRGKTVDGVTNYSGMVAVLLDDYRIVFCEGTKILFLEKGAKQPKKHQLYVEFEDGSALCVSIQMYGGLWAFREGEFDNEYYEVAKTAISPLSDAFDKEYFDTILYNPSNSKLSVKALLATQQRIPGLGNGTLQDILFNAKINPKRKVNSLSIDEGFAILESIKTTMNDIIIGGGRDTHKDIYDNYGGYRTLASKNTVNKPCPNCGSPIVKASYMGGSVYFCETCQKL